MSRQLPRVLMVAVAALIVLPLFAADGAAIYKGKCAMCHGATGAGDTTMGKKLEVEKLGSQDVQKHSDAELTKVIAKGKEKMPAFEKKLTADEIKSVVAHIRTFASKK